MSLFLLLSLCLQAKDRKNVLFIICDDLNDNVHGFGGHPQAYTPNINRLANMGVRFTNAQSNAPMCAPSRPSLLSSLYPSTTGMYGGKPKFRTLPKLQDAVLFPTHFKKHGYQVYGAGKIFHGIDKDMTIFGASKANQFDGGCIGPISNFGPYPWDGQSMIWGRPSRDCPNPYLPQTWTEYDVMKKPWSMGHGRLSELPEGMTWVYSDSGFEGIDGKDGGIFKYKGEKHRSKMPDELVADWGVDLITGIPTKAYKAGATIPLKEKVPFIISLGFIKTHFALYTPDYFYDEVLKANNMTEDDILLPWTKNGKVTFNDKSDVAKELQGGFGSNRFKVLQKAAKEYPGGLKKMLKDVTMSYLAAVYQIDVQVGKLLDALKTSGQLDNTIIVFTSDHGYHHGDKENFFKFTLWEKSARIPLIVYDPSSDFDKSRGLISEAPVSLIDIYPTLNDLCGLSPRSELEGYSLRPFLEDINNTWEGPPVALTAISGNINKRNDPNQHHFAVRSKEWRYILTNEGNEELYNSKSDPMEWDNLANNPEFESVKIELHKELCKLSGRDNLYNNNPLSGVKEDHKKDWKLVWSEEFNGDSLDRSRWEYETGFVRNKEMQYYTKERSQNVRLEDGLLVIEGRKERMKNRIYNPNSPNWIRNREYAHYTSGSIHTRGKVQFQYGRIEVRAKMPKGKGMWPAIWTLGVNLPKVGWPHCGEIDIMEYVGKQWNVIHANVHFDDPKMRDFKLKNNKDAHKKGVSAQFRSSNLSKEFHLYSVEWEEQKIRFFVNDQQYAEFNIDDAGIGGDNPFRKPHYLLLNLALGGSWGGNIEDAALPQKYLVDYVRYYK